jgi:hypothetical protein
MTTLHLTIIGALSLALSVCGSAKAESFTLVDGSTHAAIAIPAKPSEAESLAASEIAKYVEAMSAAKLEIVDTDSPPDGAIVLSARARGLAKEGYSISILEGRLYLVGARGRSVLYATYDLLERLGCRWLAPKYAFYDGKAEVVPKKDRLVIELDGPIVEQPKLKFRKLYVEEGHSQNAINLLQMIEWMSKSRENTLVVPTDYQGQGRVKWDNWRKELTPELRKRDIQIEVGGHGYQNFINAEMPEVKAHQEWLGQEGGKRQTAHGTVFCTSNADAVTFLTGNVVAYLKGHPEIDIFDFWPPDGSKWCECEACTKLGSPADRQSRLVAQVITEAKKQGIKARFECIAYAVYTQPPVDPPMDSSVLIDFCPIGQCFEVQINDPSSPKNAEYSSAIQAWKKSFTGDLSIYSYYRKYAWNSLPIIIPHYMQADLKWYASIGTVGISSYSEPGDWLTYELNHYTLARLAWNPDADVDATVSQFCDPRFGKLAGSVEKLYTALEDTARHGCSIPGTGAKTVAELDGYIKQLSAARDALASEAAGDTSVAALLASTDYALKDMALQKEIAKGSSAADVAKVKDKLTAFLKSHYGQGVFLNRRGT